MQLPQRFTHLPMREVPLFPDDVLRIMESGDVAAWEITSFEIQAVVRGLRQPERWKQRDDHYDSVCWWMAEREHQCQWYPDGNYLVFLDRATHTARQCGWQNDEIVTFSHLPPGDSLPGVVAREKGIVPVHTAVSPGTSSGSDVDACMVNQYKLHLDVDNDLETAVWQITRLVAWWLMECFQISDKRTSLFEPAQLQSLLDR